MKARTLGLFCMVGGIAYTISAVYGSVTGSGDTVDILNKLLGLVWALGAICGWLAIIQLMGTGENSIVRLLSFLPIVGLALALLSTVFGMLAAGSEGLLPLVAVGLILELVGALLVGIFTVMAGKLTGWHRFVPFFVVLGVVLGGVVSGVSGGTVQGIPLFLGVAYTLLGYASSLEGKTSSNVEALSVTQG